MSRTNFRLAPLWMLFALWMIGCNTNETKPAEPEAPAAAATAPLDMNNVKAEIQALETAWAEADNAGDVKTLTAFYADDAVTMPGNKPMISGKEAIQKDIEESMAKKVKGVTVAYEVLDVFGDENTVTEVGKTTRKDAAGKVIYTGKYMAIWQKRDGKYVCIRDIGNDDVKAQ
jgi:uncharacterized protein (TIGR02246 family)